MYPPKSILVPTDFSVHSDNALKRALAIALEHDSKIYVLHVVDEIIPLAQAYWFDKSLVQEAEKQIMKSAEEKLKQEIEATGAAKGIDIVIDLKKGRPVDTILKEQEDKGIDMIVIASSGYKTSSHQIGSVSQKVLREAKCPVMLIK